MKYIRVGIFCQMPMKGKTKLCKLRSGHLVYNTWLQVKEDRTWNISEIQCLFFMGNQWCNVYNITNMIMALKVNNKGKTTCQRQFPGRKQSSRCHRLPLLSRASRRALYHVPTFGWCHHHILSSQSLQSSSNHNHVTGL